MYGYRILRSVTLGLRSVQTALLASTFVVSDAAQQLGDKARELAHRKLDTIIAKSEAHIDALDAAVGHALARYDEARDNHDDLHSDVTARRVMIEREVL